MKKFRLALLVFAMVSMIILGACVPFSPHRQLGFQAFLANNDGIPVPNGDYQVKVTFWNHVENSGAGNLVYEDEQVVTVTDGFLNIAIPALLADALTLNPAEFAQPLWVQFEIEGETLTPRQQLLGTPYAFSLVGGALVKIGPLDAPLLIDNYPQQGALNIANLYLPSPLDSPGTTGLVVAIRSPYEKSEVIRACAGGISCSNEFLVLRVFADGNVAAKGTFISAGSGYAELLPLLGAWTAEPGDVIRLATATDGAVLPCNTPNTHRVAGVYVANPAFIAGGPKEGQDNLIPVAFSGVVPVKVTAVNGAIQRGDLLTCSNAPGFAMKSTALQIGTILGKAMESHATGTGVINVLLTLH